MVEAQAPEFPVAEELHCLYCFDVLTEHFNRALQPRTPHAPFPLDVQCPLFVTWNIRSAQSMHLQLRGCIGCLKPLPLSSLRDYALTSALHDRRFPPVEEAELPKLSCTVQLLGGFEPCSLFEWTIGVHGLTISFVDHASRGAPVRSAVYLPDVIPEQGWTQLEAIDSLIRKSGYDRYITDELRESIDVSRFVSTKHSVSYERWHALRTAPPTPRTVTPRTVAAVPASPVLPGPQPEAQPEVVTAIAPLDEHITAAAEATQEERELEAQEEQYGNADDEEASWAGQAEGWGVEQTPRA